MFEVAISVLSIFASMNPWLTHAVLFLLLNLMIGTIVVTSAFTSHKPTTNHHHHHHHHHHPQPHLQPTLTRSSSVLQRLKSTINFSSFYSHHPPSTTTTYYFQPPQPQQQQQKQPESSPLPDPEPEPEPETVIEQSTIADDEEGPTLDEIYSRIKQGNTNAHYGRQNSDTKPSNGDIPVKLPQKMKKSASDKSAFNHFDFQETVDNVGPAVIMEDDYDDDVKERENGGVKMEEEREDEGVDAKADDFINRFKKHLQLQRKESILRYKQMIHSRTADVQ